ncbi:MAG: hypothetical protein H6662_16120 [Ardenticatenaceae bacterium]|nr:hypothetical protein [Ardenticatenaceae bacterium]MCB8990019.1 hypothetical protein [Ardenticatenaceae bacterium]
MGKVKQGFFIWLVALMIGSFVACHQSDVNEVAVGETAVPSATIQPTLTATKTPLPTVTNTLSPSPTTTFTPLPPTTTATQTLPPTMTPTPTETPFLTTTPVPAELILEQFPLEVGMVRVYQVTYTYAVDILPDHFSYITDSWTGLVTETIMSQRQEGTRLIFRAKITGDPWYFDGEEVILKDHTIVYVVEQDGIRREGIKIFQFPIGLDASWDAWQDYSGNSPGWYGWVVSDIKDVITPAGYFTDCWQMFMMTQPDSSTMSICPGTGIVEWAGFQHGPIDDTSWVLYWMGEETPADE